MVTTPYVVFELETGRIVQSGNCLAEDIYLQGGDRPGVAVLPGEGELSTHYVSDGIEILAKEAMQYTPDTNGLVVTLTGLPVGTLVQVGDASITADEDPTELEFDIPGTYTITIKGTAPYLDEALEVTVG